MYSLNELIEEEESLILDQFDEQSAWDLGCLAYNWAEKRQFPVTIRIERAGQTLFQVSRKGTKPDNDLWVQGKARVVQHFLHSSYFISKKLQNMGQSLEERYFLNPRDYRAIGGAIPLFIRNSGLAAVLAVSGLKDYEDHEMCVGVLREYSEIQRSGPKDGTHAEPGPPEEGDAQNILLL
jgi:uncharacterized protein (UPF0303 family)